MIFKSHFNSIVIFDSIYQDIADFCDEGVIPSNINYNDYIIKFLNECLAFSPFQICTDLKFGDFEVYVDEEKVIDYLMGLDPLDLSFIKMEWRNSQVIGSKHPEYIKLFGIITRRITMDKDFEKRLLKYIEECPKMEMKK